jgi:hypothetical protein
LALGELERGSEASVSGGEFCSGAVGSRFRVGSETMYLPLSTD